jgi:hypothetical protein
MYRLLLELRRLQTVDRASMSYKLADTATG